MNRSRQVKEIYAELRQVLGPDYSSRDLLEFAAALLTRSNDDAEEITREGRDASFETRPVDIALADGGWRVMAYEARRGMPIAEDDPEVKLLSPRLHSLMRLAA